jgi:TrpR-related protein YerC/YecD
MFENKMKVWQRDNPQQLTEVLVAIDDEKSMQKFLRDVLTEKEIIEISSRLEAARMLEAGSNYISIAEKTKLSSRTIARISEWLKNGCKGYELALVLISKNRNHIPPASAA